MDKEDYSTNFINLNVIPGFELFPTNLPIFTNYKFYLFKINGRV